MGKNITEFRNFSQILDEHTDELAKRKHGYPDRLHTLYLEQFPEAEPIPKKRIYNYIHNYRMTHDIERIHGWNYPYLLLHIQRTRNA
jgi:hypothetical protein